MGPVQFKEWRKTTTFRACFVLVVFIVLLIIWQSSASNANFERLKSMAGFQEDSYPAPHQVTPLEDESRAACAGLPGAEDILVVFRTGTAVARDMLPFHINTTFRCTNRYIVLSDVEEDIDGHRTIDILADVPQQTRDRQPVFRVYEQVLKDQAAGKPDYKKLLESSEGSLRGPESPGWALDKWKFMPMLQKALQYDAQWYFFMETDTGLIWSNLVQWLSLYNPQDVVWLGSASPAGTLTFAHGGSGFVLSRPALQLAVNRIDDHYDYYEDLFAHDCCGDVKLGNIMKDAGVDIIRGRPSLYGGPYQDLGFNKHMWCYPAVTFHHLRGLDFLELFNLEQSWLSNPLTRQTPILLGDVFSRIIKPVMDAGTLEDWDNRSNDIEIDSISTLEGCRDQCRIEERCRQFSFQGGLCTLDHDACLGWKLEADDPRKGNMTAGFMVERLEGLQHEMEHCSPKWLTRYSEWA